MTGTPDTGDKVKPKDDSASRAHHDAGHLSASVQDQLRDHFLHNGHHAEKGHHSENGLHAHLLHGHVETAERHLPGVHLHGAEGEHAGTHIIKKGENLSRIAEKELGKGATQADIARAVKEIVKENNIVNPDKIMPNQVLHLPDLTLTPRKPSEKAHRPHKQPGSQEPLDQPHKQPGRPDEQGSPQEQQSRPQDEQGRPQEKPAAPVEQTPAPHDQTPAPQDQPPTPVSKMSQAQVDKAAEDIHKAAHNKALGGYGWSSPEAAPIKTILGSMNEADRKAVEQSYEKQFDHTKLQDDIKTQFGGDPVAQSEIGALMMRKDGKSDEAGTIHTALTKLGVDRASQDSDAEGNISRDEGEIRNALASMTAQQIAELRTTYQKNYGQSLDDAINKDPMLSPDSKAASQILLKGIDNRTATDTNQLAQIGLSSQRLDMFQEAMQYAKPEDRQAFMNAGGQEKINQAFSGGDAQVATDYAKQGYVGLNTIVNGDSHWYHTNKDDIGRAVDGASPDEKAKFQLGKQLADSGKTPQTDAEKQAADFYKQTEKTLSDVGNSREAQMWSAKLNDSPAVLTNILQTQHDGFLGIGKGHDKNELYGSIENLSQQDWGRLRQSPGDRKDIDTALRTISDDAERNRLTSMLNEKLTAGSYADSQNVGRRPVNEAFTDAGTDTGLQANALAHMTPAERAAYQSNTNGFADTLNKAVGDNMKTPGGSIVAHDILDQVKDGKVPQISAVDQVAIDSDKTDNALKSATDIEAAFKADPTLLERIKNPKNAQDQQLQQVFQSSLYGAVDKAGLGPQPVGDGVTTPGFYDDFAKTLLQTGHLPIDQKMELVGGDKQQMLSTLQMATPEEKAALLNPQPDAAAKSLQDSVLGDGDQKQLFQNVLRQGQMTDADQFRAYSLGYGGDSSPMLKKLDTMTPQQKQDLAGEYFNKYGSLISEDATSKAKPSEKYRFVEELQPADQSVRQMALDARAENDSHTSAVDRFMRDHWDYSGVAAQDNAQKLNTFVAQHASEIDALKPEQRKQFMDAVDNYQKAQQSYIDSKGAAAEVVVDAAITVAAVGGAFFSGGASLGLLGAIGVGTAGAVGRVAMMKELEGSDFDSSAKGIAEQAFKGSTAALLGFAGPEMFGVDGALAVGEGLAARAAVGILEKAAVKGIEASAYRGGEEVAQQVIKDGVAALTRRGAIAGSETSEKAIAKIAERALGDGATAEQRQALQQAIAQEVKGQVTKNIREKLVNEAESAALNVATASGTNVATEVASTAVGLSDPKTLMDRMESAAVSGAAGALVFHVGFKAASEGFHGLKAVIGKDGNGIFAGGGTKIQHSDGTQTTVNDGDKYRFKQGDKIVEQEKNNVLPNDTADTKPHVDPDRTVADKPNNDPDRTIAIKPRENPETTVVQNAPHEDPDGTILSRPRESSTEHQPPPSWDKTPSPGSFNKSFTDGEGRTWTRDNRFTDNVWKAEDGSTFTRERNKETWSYADGRQRILYANGQEFHYEPNTGWKDGEGSSVFTSPDRQTTVKTDGSVTERLNTGTVISRSADARTVDINYAGKISRVEFGDVPGGKPGELQIDKITLPNGRSQERVDANHFRDATNGNVLERDYRLDKDGNITADDGLAVTKVTPDGRVSRHASSEVFEQRGVVAASPDFVARVEHAYLEFPESVRRLLKKYGTKVVVGDTVTDVKPSLKTDSPRGHTRTWDQLEGFHSPGDKIAVVTEHYQDPKTGAQVSTQRAEGVMRHEVGHAVDDALGHFSTDPKFKAAYDADKADIMKNLTVDQQEALKYFLQGGSAGESEAFAELFGTISGGGSAYQKGGLVDKAFPRTLKALKDRLAELEATGK